MKWLFVSALFIFCIHVLSGTWTRSEEFAVNTTSDLADAAPGDGRCRTAAATCSLRAAIQEANAAIDTNTIRIPAGTYRLSLTGADEDAAATGDLDVIASVDIIGDGAGSTIIDGTRSDRVFDITVSQKESRPRVVARISGVTIANGFASDRTAGAGGGIRVVGELELRDSIVSYNEASTYGGGTQAATGSQSKTSCLQTIGSCARSSRVAAARCM
jgi:CSLREA domain-containing protein